jgi:hypothetical protein
VNPWSTKYGTIADRHLEALTSLHVIERLTISDYDHPKDDDLMKLPAHPKLPFTRCIMEMETIRWTTRSS